MLTDSVPPDEREFIAEPFSREINSNADASYEITNENTPMSPYLLFEGCTGRVTVSPDAPEVFIRFVNIYVPLYVSSL